MATAEPFNLERFVSAQEPIYRTALGEIRAGRKRSHWMWFIFPQIAGLGFSPTSKLYAISGAEEARSYLAHPLLGPRLRECADALLAVQGRSASAIFGSPDDMKLRSSMTLFAAVAEHDPRFEQVLERYYGGQRDPQTLDRLGAKR
ncbi:DUF1810 domain-containing protein [Chloroflexia bacterium SDU3-3]|nr:DUF1810 domain-containing protein [Chloroflexia bacterium SDU3-3]